MAVSNLQVYKCRVCGNIVEVIHAGGGTLVCCNQPMNLLTEDTTDAAEEKQGVVCHVFSSQMSARRHITESLTALREMT